MSSYFTISRQIAATPDCLFDVLSQPEYFSQWFGTKAVKVPLDSLVMDVRPGGEFRAVMLLPDGGRIDWTGEYVEVVRPWRVTMTLSDSPENAPGVPVEFDFEQLPSGALFTILQDRGEFTNEQVDATVTGYHGFVDDIEAIVRAL